jgi:hypothetical protein
MEDAPFTVTLKAGEKYDSPWIIVKADTAQQLSERLNHLEDLYIFQTASRVSKSLQAAYKHEQER